MQIDIFDVLDHCGQDSHNIAMQVFVEEHFTTLNSWDGSHLSLRLFPEIGVPPVIIHVQCRQTIFGCPHGYGTPHISAEGCGVPLCHHHWPSRGHGLGAATREPFPPSLARLVWYSIWFTSVYDIVHIIVTRAHSSQIFFLIPATLFLAILRALHIQSTYCSYQHQPQGVPQNGWFIRENLIKTDDLGVPMGTPHLWTHIANLCTHVTWRYKSNNWDTMHKTWDLRWLLTAGLPLITAWLLANITQKCRVDAPTTISTIYIQVAWGSLWNSEPHKPFDHPFSFI